VLEDFPLVVDVVDEDELLVVLWDCEADRSSG
jgi:hypothetical protein